LKNKTKGSHIEMTSTGNTKFRLKLGTVEVDFEGDAELLKHEIMPAIGKIIDAVADNSKLFEEGVNDRSVLNDQSLNSQSQLTPKIEQVGTLSSYLKTKKAGSTQVMRFLATSHWMKLRGNGNVSTADVVKALKENQQSSLTNPADCLNKNVAKGFCEKTLKGFFVTPEGIAELEKNSGT
jgi:hypothetical protein